MIWVVAAEEYVTPAFGGVSKKGKGGQAAKVCKASVVRCDVMGWHFTLEGRHGTDIWQ